MDSLSSKTNWPAVITLFGAGSLGAFQYAKIPFMLSGISEQVAMSEVQMALLLSVIGLVGAIAGTFFGAICRAVGLRTALLSGLLLGGVGALMPLFTDIYGILIAARLLEGVSHMAIFVSVPSLMLPFSAKDDQPKVMAIWSCCFSSTFIITAMIGAPLQAYFGWQGFAWFHAVMLLIIWFACFALPKLPQGQPYRVNFKLSSIFHSQWRLLTELKLLVIPLSFLGYTLLFVTLMSVVPLEVATSEKMRFTLAFLYPCASLVGTLIALALLRKGVASYQLVLFSTLGMLVLSVGLFFIPLTASILPVWMGVIFMVMGLLPAGVISSIPRLFLSDDPDIALVNGGLVQFGNLGNFIGAPILAVAMLAFGWTAVSLYIIGGVTVVMICLIFLRQQSLRA